MLSFSRVTVLSCVLSFTLGQFIPLPGVQSGSPTSEDYSRTFRESVAQAIRDNIAKQQRSGIPVVVDNLQQLGNTQTILFPGSPGSETSFVNAPQHPALTLPPLPVVQATSTPAPVPVTPPPVLVQPKQRRPTGRIAVNRRIKPESVIVRNEDEINTEDESHLEQLLEDQAKSAKYSFESSIQDTINDHAITRSETRDGLSLKGMYSYSDGFFKRTVYYEADEAGYRVVKEEIEPIGDGPRFNPQGKADVSSSLSGSYSITADDVKTTRDRIALTN